MSAAGRAAIELPPPLPPRGWPRERIVGYALVGLWILAGIGLLAYLVGRLEHRMVRRNTSQPTSPA